MVIQNECCKKCGKLYTEIRYEWCKPCKISNLIENSMNWTSGNKKIDNFIQKMQLKIDNYNDMIFEWIPYNQFSNTKEIDKYSVATFIRQHGQMVHYVTMKMKKCIKEIRINWLLYYVCIIHTIHLMNFYIRYEISL